MKRKQDAFDSDQVVKQLNHHDIQSWSETCIQYISVIYRTIKKFIQIHNVREANPMLDDIWQVFHEIMCEMIRHNPTNPNFNKTVSQLIMQIFKSEEDFLGSDIECQMFMVTRSTYVLSLVERSQVWFKQEIRYVQETY